MEYVPALPVVFKTGNFLKRRRAAQVSFERLRKADDSLTEPMFSNEIVREQAAQNQGVISGLIDELAPKPARLPPAIECSAIAKGQKQTQDKAIGERDLSAERVRLISYCSTTLPTTSPYKPSPTNQGLSCLTIDAIPVNSRKDAVSWEVSGMSQSPRPGKCSIYWATKRIVRTQPGPALHKNSKSQSTNSKQLSTPKRRENVKMSLRNEIGFVWDLGFV